MRQLLKKVIAVAVLALSVSACSLLQSQSEFDYAEGAAGTAVIVVPEPLRARLLDGQSPGLPLMLEFPYIMTVSAGQHTLAFQHGTNWGVGQDSELLRGPLMEVVFEAQAGERYEIDFKPPSDLAERQDAEAYFADFSAWLADSQGGRVEAVVAASQKGAGGLGGKLAAVVGADGASAEQPVSQTQAAASVDVAETNGRLQSLQSLWQSATEAERSAFMQWVIAPDKQ